MASPFDFSSFLLTPPIPNYSTTTTNQNSTSAIANTNSNNGNSGNSANSGSGSGSGSSSNNDQYRNDNQGGYQLADSNASASSYQPMNPSNLSASAPAGSGFPTPAQYGNTNAGKQSVNYASHVNHGYGYSQQPQQQNSNQYGPSASAHRQPQQLQQQQQYEQQYAQPNHQQSQQQNQSQPYYSGEQSASYGAIDPSGYPSYGDSVNHQQQSQQQQQLSYHSSSLSSNLPPVASGSSSNAQHSMNAGKMPSLDERDYGLDPSAFSSVSFQMPSFLAASSQPGEYGVGSDGPSVVDPSAFHQPAVQTAGPYPSFLTAPPAQQPPQQQQQIYSAPPNAFVQPQQPQYMSNDNQQQQQRQNGKGTSSAFTLSAIASAKKPSNKYVPDPKNPVYGIYGSSVISVNPDTTPFKLALNAAAAIPNPIAPEDSRSGTPDFDPKSLGLPVGEQLFPQPLPGLYSSSGFDMLGVLARVAARPNPQINIGPVDTSCSFLVVDARRYDMPIVFASDTFSKLTGYSNAEIIGRNCRFLQAPDGSVPAGSRRKYTDGNAVYHLKTHIQSGKETQASIINYRKDGSPFINLVTVIPIAWDTDEIAYFVGFQVDLVEQPNAILEKMRNGTYVVNYSLLPTNATAMPTTAAPPAAYPTEPQEEPIDELAYIEPRPIRMADPTASGAATAAAAHSSMTIAPELLEVMGAVGNGDELDDDAAKKKWNKMLLDHTGDFVHVLSLKGSFLYVSPSVKTMLEYDPPDLVGKTLQSVCHPSDIVPVMRELKDSSNNSQPVINLLYRFRRKNSGYIWLEAQGKLYLEQSKSRKCVILVGRERPVYKLSWNDLRAAGGLGEKEYWSKVTSNGMFLYNTPTVKTVLGHEASTLQGKSLFDLVETSKAPDLALALNDARAGKSVRLRYRLKSAKGKYIDVITNFYPNSSPVSPERKRTPGVVHPSIVLQTNEYSSEVKRRATMPHLTGALPPPTGILSPGGTDLANGRPNLLRASSAFRDMVVTTPEPSDDGNTSGSGSASGSGSGSDSSAPSTFSAIPSTYKTLLSQASAQSDNLFDELDTTRTTSWQYELHQLKLTNKKLKEELSMLQAARRKRKKKEEMGKQGSSTSAASPQPPAQQQLGLKTCANCGRTDSPEWRVGPTGIRNLCNACGLRWAKATRTHRQSSSTPSGSTSSSANSDMENAASGYMQPGGPFAIQRPPFQHAESSRFNQSGH